MQEHRNNPAALRPHHKNMLEEIKEMYILPAQDFLSWGIRNLELLCNDKKEDHDMLRRAERVAHLATQGSYVHFYKTPPALLTFEPFPLDTLYARLAITWNRVVSDVAQSFVSKQEITVGSFTFVFDAELCLVKLTPLTCFLVPYSLILCFADMCAAWFSVDSYAAIHDRKYPGYSLLFETKTCFKRMMDLLSYHQQRA